MVLGGNRSAVTVSSGHPKMDTNSLTCPFGLGMQVNIKRTDGRVHTAVVSGVNHDSRSITVEWFERNETKGKEVNMKTISQENKFRAFMAHTPHGNWLHDASIPLVDMEMIYNLNPHVTGVKSVIQADTVNQVEDMPFAPPVRSSDKTQSGISPAMRPPEPPPQSSRNGTNSSSSSVVAGVPVQTRSQNLGRIPRINRQTVMAPSKPVAIVDSTPPSNVPTDTEDQHMEVVQTASSGGGTVTRDNNLQLGGPRRKTNVVHEVEKLKKNREERRIRQAEKKTEKENQMNLDPGNPNWEFLAMVRDYRQGLEIKPLVDTDPVEDHQITVCVRKRPMNKKEIARKEVDVITVPNKNQMSVHEPKQKVDLTKYLENQHYRFDYAFDEGCSNEIVYKFTARPLVQTIFEGGMATCFAYGQTGSGKTHTMGGDFNGKIQDCQKGIYAMTAKDVFRLLKLHAYRNLNLHVSCSFFEIYSGKVFDLLAGKAKLRVLEDGKQQVQIIGLTEKGVDGVEDVLKLIQIGNQARTSGQTSANSNSSRSHAVFQVILRGAMSRVHGKFSLIDLAGNERGADTSSADRQTRMEGAEINKSLLALKECVRALGLRGSHLPFRASKLTQVLRDSFMGDKSRTCMIAMISPGMSSCEHSINTLRYADRVKGLTAHDPMEIKMSALNEDEVMDSQSSDLAQLRSLNEHEMSGEMLTFHETVSKLNEAEEEMVEYHKQFFDMTPQWNQQHKMLLGLTNQVQFDTEAYATRVLELINEKTHMLEELRQRVAKFRALAAEEENASKKMNTAKPRR